MRYRIMQYATRDKMIYATALLVLAIPGLLGGARPANADATPTPAKIGQTWTRPKDGAAMVAVPTGKFTMGSNDWDDTKPQRKVMLDGYWIDKNLVTVAHYRKFCKATGRKMPDPPNWGWKDVHPMVNVTWPDAKAYADWAGASLPTEAQWEKAARGTDGRKYPWGNDFDRSRLLWRSQSASGHAESTVPVGSFATGASPYGALDMAGNVCEWCADWYNPDYYKGAPAQNPTGPGFGKSRALRGGSWLGPYRYLFRCAFRYHDAPGGRYNYGGFRCVVRAGG